MKKLIALIISLILIISSVMVAFAQESHMGDSDGNGKVDIADVTVIQRYIASIISDDRIQKDFSDVDGDGKITIMDCTSIQQFVADIITTFPCERNNPTEPTEETLNVNTDSLLKPAETQAPDYIPEPTQEPTQEPTISSEQRCKEMEQEILRLVNIEREKAGLQSVAFAYDYYECAKIRAVECSTPETFSHTRPDSREWHTVFKDLSTPFYWAAGENIALYFQSAQEVVDAWMNSPGHRANILYPDFNLLAVGVYETPEWEGYYSGVQLFIKQ